MEISIKSQKELPLLHRKDYVIEVSYGTATPQRLNLKGLLKSHVKPVDEKLMIVKKITTTFGAAKAEVIVRVYSDEKMMQLLEHKKMIEKNLPKAEKKEEAEA